MVVVFQTIKEILSFPLIEVKNFVLTPYNILAFFVFILIGRIIVWLLKKTIHKVIEGKPNFTPRRELAIFQIVKYIIYTVALIIALQSIGLDVTVLIAGSTALLVALGLGLQGFVNEFFSGIVLLSEGSISVNDVIEVDGKTGKVVEIGIRSTKIETRTGIAIVVPNSKFITGSVINYNQQNGYCAFIFSVEVSYQSDVELVTQVLLDSTYSVEEVRKDPPVVIYLKDFGDSALIFDILYYTNNIFGASSVSSQIRYKIFENFRKNNIQIPFPQRVLHIETNTDSEKVL